MNEEIKKEENINDTDQGIDKSEVFKQVFFF